MDKIYLTVTGSRSITDREFVFACLDKWYNTISKIKLKVMNKVIVMRSGHAVGVDRLCEEWAEENGIEVELYLPSWKKYGKRAGILRNADMILGNRNLPQTKWLVAMWDKESKGTKHAIDCARNEAVSIEVTVFEYPPPAQQSLWQ